MFWTILFYAVCAVGALLFVGLLYYRIDWARHPEKYQDLVDQAEKDEKEAAQRRAMRRLGRKKMKRANTGRKRKKISSCAKKRPRTRQRL